MKEYREIMLHICDKCDKYEEMIEYKVIMEELMHKLERHYPELFKETMNKLEEVAYEIPLEKAQSIVRTMKPFGEHWSYDTVKSFVEGKGIYKCFVKYYLVMNMIYNDYYDVAINFGHQNDAEFYYELAHAFINDVDGKKFKVEKYFID